MHFFILKKNEFQIRMMMLGSGLASVAPEGGRPDPSNLMAQMIIAQARAAREGGDGADLARMIKHL
jgi:hypothetical protein